MNVLVLEPWYGGSHRRFADGLAAHSRHDVRLVTLSARAWTWRMQGGAVALADRARAAMDSWTPDLVVATDMVNLPAFLALTRDRLAHVPVLLLFHENQLTYPLPDDASGAPSARDLTYALINVLSMIAADRVVFNSQFHLDELFAALPEFLRRFPDHPLVGRLPGLLAKSSVLHLGVDLAALDAARPAAEARRVQEPGPPVVLWNHRWEYDKGPEAFFRVLGRLDDIGARFRLVLAGETFAEAPAAFDVAVRRYADRLLHVGFAASPRDYAALLWRSDIAVSTSRHEFFGLSMLEAIHCGCHPLLPDRLSYPELIPAALHRPLLHAPILYDGEDALFDTLRRLLDGRDLPLPPDVLRRVTADLDWPLHVAAFDDLFEGMRREA